MKILLNTLYLAVLFICFGCSETEHSPEIDSIRSEASLQDNLGARRLIASISDEVNGALSSMDIDSPWNTSIEVAPAGPNAILREFYGQLYLVNRSQARIDLLDKETLLPIKTFATGSGTEPRDILVINKRLALITDYNGTNLLLLNLASGEIRPFIDLSFYSDEDGFPEMNMMERIGNKVYIQIQRWNRNNMNSSNNAYLAVINLEIRTSPTQLDYQSFSAQLLPGIALQGKKPDFKMQVNKDRLYVAAPGDRLDHVGATTGIEEIDLQNEQSLGFFILEKGLGGDMGPFVIIDENNGYAVFHTSIVLSTHLAHFKRGQTFGELHSTTEGWVDAIAYDKDTQQIFYAEPSAPSGFTRHLTKPGHVIVFDAKTATQLSNPIGLGGRPVDLLVY
jgi:hypothetical protein